MRRAGIAVIICISFFVILMFVAMALYPGGSGFDETSVGHRFWENFWCDILDRTARNGLANPGRPFAIVGTLYLVVASILLVLFFPLQMTRKQKGSILLLGILSVLFAGGVQFEHDFYLNITATLAFASFFLFLTQAAKSSYKAFAVIGFLTYITGIANFFLWMQNPEAVILPVLQKLSTILYVGWIYWGGGILIRTQRTRFTTAR